MNQAENYIYKKELDHYFKAVEPEEITNWELRNNPIITRHGIIKFFDWIQNEAARINEDENRKAYVVKDTLHNTFALVVDRLPTGRENRNILPGIKSRYEYE